jgi:hypothetical protein
VSIATAKLPPLDTEPAAHIADADLRRRERYLRRLLAEGGFTPARLNLISAELRDAQATLRQREGK